MSACALTEAARKVARLPEDWHGWIFESVVGAVLVTGAVCPPITRGPRKGQPNYRKANPETKCTVSVPAGMLRD